MSDDAIDELEGADSEREVLLDADTPVPLAPAEEPRDAKASAPSAASAGRCRATPTAEPLPA
jgi:hypothetical protein